MIPRSSVKPLELVISAIHCLKERRGSSPQDILKYLLGKYDVDPNSLKTHVQAGLKRGLSFGLITQKSGLYRLNDILSSPVEVPPSLKKPPKTKVSKINKTVKKQKPKKTILKRGRRSIYQNLGGSMTQRGRRRRVQKTKDKKRTVKKRSSGNGPRSSYKKRKPKRQRAKIEKAYKPKLEKPTKIKPERVTEATKAQNNENSDIQRGSGSSKESENVKNIVKT